MRIPRPFVENWGLKLFSLALGVVIFLAVRNEQRLSATVAVRLLVSEPADLINTGEVPPEVLVKLSGPWGTLQSLDAKSLPAVEVDLAGLPRGTSTVRVREEQLGLPPDVQVVSMSPSALTVRLETREKRVVPVKVNFRGEPAAGFQLGKPAAEPAEVEIEGPRREVRDVASVRTAPVDVGGAREEVLVAATLEAPAQHTRVIGAARAAVRIPVGPTPGERTVRLRVAAPAGPTVVRAVLRGPKEVLDRLDETALRASADAGARGRGPVPVRIEGLPEGVTVAEPGPSVRLRR